MEEAGGRQCEESRVEDQGSCRSNEMKGRCENNCGGDEVYPATFRNEEENGLKLNDDEVSYFTDHKVHFKSFFFSKIDHAPCERCA